MADHRHVQDGLFLGSALLDLVPAGNGDVWAGSAGMDPAFVFRSSSGEICIHDRENPACLLTASGDALILTRGPVSSTTHRLVFRLLPEMFVSLASSAMPVQIGAECPTTNIISFSLFVEELRKLGDLSTLPIVGFVHDCDVDLEMSLDHINSKLDALLAQPFVFHLCFMPFQTLLNGVDENTTTFGSSDDPDDFRVSFPRHSSERYARSIFRSVSNVSQPAF